MNWSVLGVVMRMGEATLARLGRLLLWFRSAPIVPNEKENIKEVV